MEMFTSRAIETGNFIIFPLQSTAVLLLYSYWPIVIDDCSYLEFLKFHSHVHDAHGVTMICQHYLLMFKIFSVIHSYVASYVVNYICSYIHGYVIA